MAIYGRGQMLGSGINPESFKQDYSGFADAAATQARGMANLGASIGGVIKEFGEAKKEQKKVDAYNKASAKAIEAAITLGGSYGITGAEETLRPFLKAYNDPSLSPIEKAALLDEGKGMIPNVFGRFDARQADAIQMAQLNARNAPLARSVNLQQGKITETINGIPHEVPTTFDPSTGETRRLDGSVVGSAFRSPDVIDAGLNLPMPTAEGTAMPGDGTFPDYGGISEAMALPPRINPAAIAAAAELTGGQSDVSNVSPMPMATPTTTQVPVVDEVPIGQAGGGMIPPGATPVKVEGMKSFRRATPEEAAGYGATAGQIDEQTNRFYPINLPSGMTVESDGQGGIKVVQGAGVGAKAEKAEKAERLAKFQETRQTNFIIDKANEAEEIIDNSISTYGGGTFIDMAKATIPGTQEYKLKNQIFPALKDSIALDSIRQLKAASPTGSTGLGSVTEKEGKRLENMYGVLDVNGDKVTLKNDIKRLKQTAFDYIHGTKDEREEALAKGNITKEQNDQVEQMYREQILGIPAAKSAVTRGFQLLPDEQRLIERHKTKRKTK